MRRAVFLALLAGGLAALGATAAGAGTASWRDPTAPTTALGRAEATDVPAPSMLTRGREQLERDHSPRRDVAGVLTVAAALVLAGAGWLRRERNRRVAPTLGGTTPRTRAPPAMPGTVHC